MKDYEYVGYVNFWAVQFASKPTTVDGTSSIRSKKAGMVSQLPELISLHKEEPSMILSERSG